MFAFFHLDIELACLHRQCYISCLFPVCTHSKLMDHAKWGAVFPLRLAGQQQQLGADKVDSLVRGGWHFTAQADRPFVETCFRALSWAPSISVSTPLAEPPPRASALHRAWPDPLPRQEPLVTPLLSEGAPAAEQRCLSPTATRPARCPALQRWSQTAPSVMAHLVLSGKHTF